MQDFGSNNFVLIIFINIILFRCFNGTSCYRNWTMDVWLFHLSVQLNYENCKIKLYWSNALIN